MMLYSILYNTIQLHYIIWYDHNMTDSKQPAIAERGTQQYDLSHHQTWGVIDYETRWQDAIKSKHATTQHAMTCGLTWYVLIHSIPHLPMHNIWAGTDSSMKGQCLPKSLGQARDMLEDCLWVLHVFAARPLCLKRCPSDSSGHAPRTMDRTGFGCLWLSGRRICWGSYRLFLYQSRAKHGVCAKSRVLRKDPTGDDEAMQIRKPACQRLRNIEEKPDPATSERIQQKGWFEFISKRSWLKSVWR